MTWGYYEVVVVGEARDGNYGECRSQLFISCMLHICMNMYSTYIAYLYICDLDLTLYILTRDP